MKTGQIIVQVSKEVGNKHRHFMSLFYLRNNQNKCTLIFRILEEGCFTSMLN